MKKSVRGLLCLMVLFATSMATTSYEIKAVKSSTTTKIIQGYIISGYVEKIDGRAICMTSEPRGTIDMWSAVYGEFVSGGPQISSTLWYKKQAMAVLNGEKMPVNVKGNHYARGFGQLIDWTSYI